MDQDIYSMLDEVFGTQLSGKENLVMTIYPEEEVIIISSKIDFCVISKNLKSNTQSNTFRVKQTVWSDGKKVTVLLDDAVIPSGSEENIQYVLRAMGSLPVN